MLARHRDRFRSLRTMQELVDFSFDVHAPGRILQMPERNIGIRPHPTGSS